MRPAWLAWCNEQHQLARPPLRIAQPGQLRLDAVSQRLKRPAHPHPCSRHALLRIKQRTGRAPRASTADRGYSDPGVEDALRVLGVRHVVLPTKGKPNAVRRQVENRRAFKTMVR